MFHLTLFLIIIQILGEFVALEVTQTRLADEICWAENLSVELHSN